MFVHSTGHGLLHIFIKCVGTHGYNRHLLTILPVQLPNGFRSLQAVHFRHHDVHQYQIIGIFRHFHHPFYRQTSVFDTVHLNLIFFQNCLNNFQIQFIILNHQHFAALKGTVLRNLFLFFLFFSGKFQLQGKAEFTSLSWLTLQHDITSHQLYQPTADSQSKTISLSSADFSGICLFKALENLLLIFFADTNSVISYRKEQFCSALTVADFPDAQTDHPIFFCKLHCISNQINQYLIDAKFISVISGMLQVHNLPVNQMLLLQPGCKQFVNIVHHLSQIKIIQYQLHSSAVKY